MKIEKMLSPDNKVSYILLDDEFNIVEEVSSFLKHLQQKGKSQTTIESYCRDLKEYYTWLNEQGVKFYEVQPRMMYSWIDFLDHQVGRGNIKAGATVNRSLATLSTFYRFFETMHGYLEMIDIGPTPEKTNKNRFFNSVYTHLVSPKQVIPSEFRREEIDNGRVKRLFPQQIKKLYDAIEKEDDKWDIVIRDKLMFRILYEAGLRIGECLGLRLIDFSEPDATEEFGAIYVVKRVETVYHKDHLVKTISREIPVSMDLIFAIDDYICNYRPQRELCDTIFVNHRPPDNGLFVKRRPVEVFFEKISRKTGIKCTPHLLRHTHGTELAEAGYNLLYIANRLGHKSIKTTKKYVHISLEAQTNAYQSFIETRKSAVLA